MFLLESVSILLDARETPSEKRGIQIQEEKGITQSWKKNTNHANALKRKDIKFVSKTIHSRLRLQPF